MPKNILIAQTFIVSGPGTYWDYRDYICCLNSNLSLKNYPIRLNIEKGTEWVGEFIESSKKNMFGDFRITTEKPISWSGFMLKKLEEVLPYWVMPFPGDHIYLNQDEDVFLKSIEKAEELGADAVAYSHIQDWEFFLDWNRINILYNDQKYILIEWGYSHKYKQNNKLQVLAKKLLKTYLAMPPVPGFLIYKTELFRAILNAMPDGNFRWQDMETSKARSCRNYKILIPKQVMYRHVHGYWFEGLLKKTQGIKIKEDLKEEVVSWYIPTLYDWKKNTPKPLEYLYKCLNTWTYFARYLIPNNSRPKIIPNQSLTPFDSEWKPRNYLIRSSYNIYRNVVNDWPRYILARIRDRYLMIKS